MAPTAVRPALRRRLRPGTRSERDDALRLALNLDSGGLKPDGRTILLIAIGVALVAALGEGARLLRPSHESDP